MADIKKLPYRRQPCPECPFRCDTEPGQFPRERYEALQSTVGRPGAEAGIDAPIFACHMSKEGRESACAGWLAVVGLDHLGIRIAVAQERLPPTVLRPAPDWPELFSSYDEMAKVQSG